MFISGISNVYLRYIVDIYHTYIRYKSGKLYYIRYTPGIYEALSGLSYVYLKQISQVYIKPYLRYNSEYSQAFHR